LITPSATKKRPSTTRPMWTTLSLSVISAPSSHHMRPGHTLVRSECV
jgi:hypothetical protein